MATRILGIDLGAYSVKVAVANPGFRHAQMTEIIERPVPPGDEPHEVRAARVVGEIIRTYKLEDSSVYLAVSGDHLFTHVLEFGFRNLRRAELEKAVGAELEGILPVDLEDMSYAFEILPDDLAIDATAAPVVDLGAPLEADDVPTQVKNAPQPATPAVVHGRVAAPTDGMRILACAVTHEWGRRLLDLLEQQGAEPRGLIATPAPYARIAETIAADVAAAGKRGKAAPGPSRPPLAVIDIGHARTDVCVVKDGKPVFTRTIARGGADVTEAISRAWRLSREEAENAKHTDGFVASAAEPATSEAWSRVNDVVVGALAPLARELRRTFNACRAKTGAMVSAAVLVGGGSRLRGIGSYLSEQLHVRAVTLTGHDSEKILGARLASQGVPGDVAALAVGVALEGGTGKPSFDLRQGDLVYQADLSFLRTKAPQLAAAALVIIAFAAFNAYASLYKMRNAQKVLDQRVALESTALFGEQLDASAVLSRTGGVGPKEESPLPRMSAYDVLLELNSALPERTDVTLDVLDLDIKPGKIALKATAKSTQEIDQLEESIKKVKCLSDLTRGDVSAGSDDTRNFSFTIKSTCM